MDKRKCANCGSERKLISCITHKGARVHVCASCFDEMKREKESRK